MPFKALVSLLILIFYKSSEDDVFGLLSLRLSAEMALRGGDHWQVEDSEVQRRLQRKLQEESPQPKASQRLRQQRERLRLRGTCL